MMSDIRGGGIRSALRKHGWKLGAVIFVYYVVRDVTLYLLLPAIVAGSL